MGIILWRHGWLLGGCFRQAKHLTYISCFLGGAFLIIFYILVDMLVACLICAILGLKWYAGFSRTILFYNLVCPFQELGLNLTIWEEVQGSDLFLLIWGDIEKCYLGLELLLICFVYLWQLYVQLLVGFMKLVTSKWCNYSHGVLSIQPGVTNSSFRKNCISLTNGNSPCQWIYYSF